MKTASPDNVVPEARSLRFFDADALSEAVRSSHFEHVQLEGGNFRAELQRLDVGHLTIDSGCYTRKVMARGDFPPGSIIVGCVLHSREEGCINGHRFRSHDVVIFPAGAELDYVQPAATHWCAIQLSAVCLDEIGCADLNIDKIKVLSGNQPFTRLIGGLMRSERFPGPALATRPGLQPPPREELLLDPIRQLLIARAGDSVHVRRPNMQTRMAVVRRFEQKVRERIDTVLRIPDLCAALGVRERALEYLFRQEIGMTPKQFSAVVRLNAIRHELMRSNTGNQTISQIAGRYGVGHLGRFAAAYLDQFGERPSDTLRRRRLHGVGTPVVHKPTG